jgi:hypothetical protein
MGRQREEGGGREKKGKAERCRGRQRDGGEGRDKKDKIET